MALDETTINSMIAATTVLSILGVCLSGFAIFCLLKIIKHLPANLRMLTASLFAADLVVFLGLPGLCHLQLHGDMDTEMPLCTLMLLLLPLGSNAQFQHHALIGLDRYIAISRPLRYTTLVTRKRLAIAMGVCWTAGTLIGATMSLGEPVGPVHVCTGHVSLITSSVALGIYGMSGVAIAFFYILTFRIAWRHHRELNRTKMSRVVSALQSCSLQMTLSSSSGQADGLGKTEESGNTLMHASEVKTQDGEDDSQIHVKQDSNAQSQEQEDNNVQTQEKQRSNVQNQDRENNTQKQDSTFQNPDKRGTVRTQGADNLGFDTENENQNLDTDLGKQCCKKTETGKELDGIGQNLEEKEKEYSQDINDGKNVDDGLKREHGHNIDGGQPNDDGHNTENGRAMKGPGRCAQDPSLLALDPSGPSIVLQPPSVSASEENIQQAENDMRHDNELHRRTNGNGDTQLPDAKHNENPNPQVDGQALTISDNRKSDTVTQSEEDSLLKQDIKNDKSPRNGENENGRLNKGHTGNDIEENFHQKKNGSSVGNKPENGHARDEIHAKVSNTLSSGTDTHLIASATNSETRDAVGLPLKAANKSDTSFKDTLRSTKVSVIILGYYILSWVPTFILGMGTITFGVSADTGRLLHGCIPLIMTSTGLGHFLLYFGIQRRVRRVVRRRLCTRGENARRMAASFTFW